MMRRTLAIVPLFVLMQGGVQAGNYFSCTTFPDYGLHVTFVVHYAVVSSGSRQVVLLVSDQQTYPCTNYRLDSGVSVTGQKVLVSMSGNVIKPDVCVAAAGPAQYQTALPVAPGTYDLDFARGGAVDQYRLIVTPTAISITTIESSFSRPE